MFLAVYILRCWDSEPLVICVMGRSLPVMVLCSDRIIQCRAQHSLACSYPQLVAYRKVDALLGFFPLGFYGSVLFNMRFLATPVLGTLVRLCLSCFLNSTPVFSLEWAAILRITKGTARWPHSQLSVNKTALPSPFSLLGVWVCKQQDFSLLFNFLLVFTSKKTCCFRAHERTSDRKVNRVELHV